MIVKRGAPQMWPPLVNVYSLQWKDPPFFMGKSIISMAIFNSFLYVHQRVIIHDMVSFKVIMNMTLLVEMNHLGIDFSMFYGAFRNYKMMDIAWGWEWWANPSAMGNPLHIAVAFLIIF